MRRRRGIAITRALVVALLLIVALLLAGAIPYGVREWRIDRCLDAGGAWDERAERCVFAAP